MIYTGAQYREDCAHNCLTFRKWKRAVWHFYSTYFEYLYSVPRCAVLLVFVNIFLRVFCQSLHCYFCLQSCVMCRCCCLLCDWTMNVSGSSGWLAFTVSPAGDCTSFLNVCLSGLAIDFVSVCLYYSCFPLCITSNTHIQTQTLSVLTLLAPGSLLVHAGQSVLV